ncbi:unnamed protein product [Amaranthus hypochondriacus]
MVKKHKQQLMVMWMLMVVLIQVISTANLAQSFKINANDCLEVVNKVRDIINSNKDPISQPKFEKQLAVIDSISYLHSLFEEIHSIKCLPNLRRLNEDCLTQIGEIIIELVQIPENVITFKHVFAAFI